jgi:hypothetical protein
LGVREWRARVIHNAGFCGDRFQYLPQRDGRRGPRQERSAEGAIMVEEKGVHSNICSFALGLRFAMSKEVCATYVHKSTSVNRVSPFVEPE